MCCIFCFHCFIVEVVGFFEGCMLENFWVGPPIVSAVFLLGWGPTCSEEAVRAWDTVLA